MRDADDELDEIEAGLAELERIMDDEEQAEQISRMESTMEISWMIRRDVPSVLAIDNASYPIPMEEDEFLDNLRKRNCIAITVKDGDFIRGFAMYELHKHRLELIRFAVDPFHRRMGYGSALLQRLKHKLRAQGRTELWADVPDNLDTCAFRFLASHGMRAVQMFRGGVGERDRYRFVYSVEQSAGVW